MALILQNKMDILVVRLLGDLDLVTADEIRAKIDYSLVETNSQYLLLDLSQITFMDSSGLGVILGRYRRLKEQGGQMIIFGAQAKIKKILEISGIISLMPVCQTEEEAWQLIEKRRQVCGK